jgi:uncharacterized membrane protein
MDGANPAEGGSQVPVTKEDAQRRADRIRAFTGELAVLEGESVVRLTDEQRGDIADYHGEILRSLAHRFDIDIGSAEKQMSMGMRIVSFLGAIALSAAVYFFFQRFWGLLSIPAQVTILVAAPPVLLAGVELAARRERTLYLASLISLVAFTAFILNLSMIGRIFTITPTQNAFLAWGVFALILAYTYRLRSLLVAGLACLLGYLTATMGTWSGCYWLSFGERPENFLAAGFALFAATFIPHPRHREFAPVYRIFGLLTVLIAVLVLSHWGAGSYLTVPAKTAEHLYQVAGFVLAGLTIWLGIRRHWSGVINLGSTFFVIFIYTKLYDWWWDWMPKYLFFLLLGAIAVLILLVLRRLRSRVREETQ